MYDVTERAMKYIKTCTDMHDIRNSDFDMDEIMQFWEDLLQVCNT